VSGDCFIYGSLHVKMPRRDVVERVLGVVDYVLLEGFDASNWRELIKRDWRTAIVAVNLLIYQALYRLPIMIASLYYRLRYGIDFRGDMRYVAKLARRAGRRVETVDENLLSIYEKDREVFSPRLILIPLILLLCCAFALSVAAVRFLIGHYAQATIQLTLILTFVVVIIIVANPLILTDPFIKATKTIRDAKLINRVQELVSQGHKVLVVRGEEHVDYIVSELRRRGVECEVLNQASPHRPSTALI
jgi:hypothetical protein